MHGWTIGFYHLACAPFLRDKIECQCLVPVAVCISSFTERIAHIGKCIALSSRELSCHRIWWSGYFFHSLVLLYVASCGCCEMHSSFLSGALWGWGGGVHRCLIAPRLLLLHHALLTTSLCRHMSCNCCMVSLCFCHHRCSLSCVCHCCLFPPLLFSTCDADVPIS
jgi:hypothetical protein